MKSFSKIIHDKSPPSSIYSIIQTQQIQMKKISILALSVLFINVTATCQITKGNWMIGGNTDFSSTSNKSEEGQRTTAFTIQITPNIGYFIADKFATGLKVSVGKEGVKATGTSRYSTYTNANFGPFLRYYFLPTDKLLNVLVEGVYQYGFIAGDNNKVFKNTFSISGGPVVYFNSSVGLEFLIGYSTFKYVGFAGSNGTVQVGLGLQVHLEKDK
jgi:hypothetical protein